MKPEEIKVGSNYLMKNGQVRYVEKFTRGNGWHLWDEQKMVHWRKVSGPKGTRLHDSCTVYTFAAKAIKESPAAPAEGEGEA